MILEALIVTSLGTVTTAGFRAWPRVVEHRCHHNNVVRLTDARENGTEFDLPAALRQLRSDKSRQPRRIRKGSGAG